MNDAAPGTQLVVREDVQTALEAFAEQHDARTAFGVLRLCARGELLLDATDSTIADPASPFQQGDTLALASQVDAHGKRLLLAFTSNERIAGFRGTAQTRSLVQPATAVLRQAMDDYDGIAIDAGTAAPAILYSAEIRAGLTDDPAANEAILDALVAQELSMDDFLGLLGAAQRVFIPTIEQRDAAGAVTGLSVPAASGPDGGVYGLLFTSPAEVVAWAPDAVPRATGAANVARVALQEGQAGVVVNPMGPSVPLGPEQLRKLAEA